MRLYFVRHGQSLDASLHRHQKEDSKLSALGKKQAKYLGKRLKNVPLDFIYSSPFTRALETANIISKIIDKPVEVMESISEHRRPTVQEGLSPTHQLAMLIKKLTKENMQNPDWKYEDGESVRELWQRVEISLNHLVEKHSKDNVLVVSHGNFIRSFVAKVLVGEDFGIKDHYLFRKHFVLNNTGVSLLDYDEEQFWRVIFWNDLAHIESIEEATI